VTGKPAGARPNREGKPWKRADGRWQARAYPPGGGIDTRPRYVYGKTRREAMEKRADLEAKLAQGLPEDPAQTVADAFARWLGVTLPQYVRAGRLAASTMDSYRDNARLHILSGRDGIGHIRLAELRADTVRDQSSHSLRALRPASRLALYGQELPYVTLAPYRPHGEPLDRFGEVGMRGELPSTGPGDASKAGHFGQPREFKGVGPVLAD